MRKPHATRPCTVKISGDVMVPNTVTFKEGLKVKDYINLAGGYGNRANKGKVFVVYMNGMVERAKRSTVVEPGCQIIVPSKPDKKGFDESHDDRNLAWFARNNGGGTGHNI